MSHNLELPDPIYDALQQAAAANGTTPLGWIAAHLPGATQVVASNGAKSLADLFAGRTGRIASGGDLALSENCGERFTEHLEDKRREGRL
ncbi:MAG TPA: hypothetical protein VGK58_17830 [Lacipirellulaceae bacterium]